MPRVCKVVNVKIPHTTKDISAEPKYGQSKYRTIVPANRNEYFKLVTQDGKEETFQITGLKQEKEGFVIENGFNLEDIPGILKKIKNMKIENVNGNDELLRITGNNIDPLYIALSKEGDFKYATFEPYNSLENFMSMQNIKKSPLYIRKLLFEDGPRFFLDIPK